MDEKEIRPIVITEENGTKYTLEFSRESVQRAESMGLNINEIGDKPATMIPLFFYCAFYMHHKNLVSRQKSDKILEDMGGLSEKVTERLVELYMLPLNYLVQDEGNSKNSKVTVEL